MKLRESRWLLLLGALVCLLVGCGTKVQPTGQPTTLLPAAETPDKTEAEPDAPTEAPVDEDATTAPSATEPGTDTKKPGGSKKPHTTGTAGRGADHTALYEKLTEIAKTAQSYYSKNADTQLLVSQNAKLYSYLEKKEVNLDYLSQKAGLSDDLLSVNCTLLLLKSEDVAAYPLINLPKDTGDFSVFAAVQDAEGKQVLLSASKGKAGALSQEEYQSLLGKYVQAHGKTGALVPGGERYERILDFIRLYEGRFDPYFVRQITANQKYAVVVLSPQADATDIRQYILKSDNGFWEVAASKVENEATPIVAVNRKLPDLDLRLIPGYTLSAYKNALIKDYTHLTTLLRQGAMIRANEDVLYLCATTNYAYAVTKEGRKYLGENWGDGWTFVPMNSAQEARTKLEKLGGGQPIFLLLDE